MNKPYECTICLETAKEPVVTKCGHIYCWPCIYSWLEARHFSAPCPNCKNIITKDELIPIYTNEQNSKNTNRFRDIPHRPQGERNQNQEESNNNSYRNSNSFNFSFNIGGFSIFDTFFNNMFQNQNFNQNSSYNNNNSNNQSNNNNNSLNMDDNFKNALKNLFILLFMVLFFCNNFYF